MKSDASRRAIPAVRPTCVKQVSLAGMALWLLVPMLNAQPATAAGTLVHIEQSKAFAIAPSGPWSREQVDAAFDHADANHDGKLTADEAPLLVLKPRPFNEMDRNHDGAVSRPELEGAADAASQRVLRPAP